MILKEAGFHLFHGQWLHSPVEAVEFQSIKLAWLGSDRIPQRSTFKEIGRLLERSESGIWRKLLSDVALNQHVRVPIIAVQFDPVLVKVFMNLEGGVTMHAGEQSTARQGVEPGRRVPARDENSFPHLSLVVPLHGDPVGSVFGGDAQEGW